ncbi:hypothetical protein [Halobaculum marinum]|uniref:DUF8134 domain-containing protein n=1 Tax=Halobaculum marinum TaxID=3031996 RepID=A0ABD5WTA3_9EURY|nr:hypothetical protein [Halobaculum sp. DT55]
MSVALRVLDDGAWVSVNDERQVSVSELWRIAGTDTAGVCACDCADFVVEAFTDVGAVGQTVTADVAGQCIRCGEAAHVPGVSVGRVVDERFRPVAPDAVRSPNGGLGAPQSLPVPGSAGED